jgi:O-methyltransferase involved in polyketide biosynthesis
MEAEKVRLTKEKETYLATLYGKTMDAAVENPILGDRFAAAAGARIDSNFNALKLPSGGEISRKRRLRPRSGPV